MVGVADTARNLHARAAASEHATVAAISNGPWHLHQLSGALERYIDAGHSALPSAPQVGSGVDILDRLDLDGHSRSSDAGLILQTIIP